MKKVENIDPIRQIRDEYDNDSITVYQAYNHDIANAAVNHQRFVAPFKIDRMTWIKPSFLWMMYRCGWGTKEGQSNILEIKIKRLGFDWALSNACLSNFDLDRYASYEDWKKLLKEKPVRIQWDPERDVYFNPLQHRSIQIGLSGRAVELYVNEWTISIQDISEKCRKIKRLVDAKNADYEALLPFEQPYSLNPQIAYAIGSFNK